MSDSIHITNLLARNALAYLPIICCVIVIAGCSILRDSSYKVVPMQQKGGVYAYRFVYGIGLFHDVELNKEQAISNLISAELVKLKACPNGFTIISQGEYQGGGYLFYDFVCK